MKKTRILALLLIVVMACSVCAFAMGPPPDGMGPPPDGGGGAPPADAAPAAEEPAAGPATGGIAIAYALFSLCALGTAVSVPVAIKKK